ncbi:MAG: EamA family transporter [Firmicutes bacterium]|nr:EamA family transporter [Bacillota bacterium]
MNNRLKGILITVFAGICWGFSGSCGQFLFDNKGVISNWLVPIRLITAGTSVLLFLLVVDRKKVLAPWKVKRDAKEMLIFAIAGMALCQYSYFTAIQHSNAGVATVLQYTGPILILAWLCMKQKRLPRRFEIIALGLVLGGAFLLATHGDLTTMTLTKPAIIWGVISAVALAIYSVQPERLLGIYGSLATTGWGMFIGGIVLNIMFKPWTITGVTVDGGTILALFGVIFFGTILAFCMYLTGVKYIGSTDAAMVSCVEPIAAVLFSAVWLGESFAFIDIIGMVLIIAGVLIISLVKDRG